MRAGSLRGLLGGHTGGARAPSLTLLLPAQPCVVLKMERCPGASLVRGSIPVFHPANLDTLREKHNKN